MSFPSPMTAGEEPSHKKSTERRSTIHSLGRRGTMNTLMNRRSSAKSVMEDNRRMSTKSAHFDEQNLKDTFHPMVKDYGLMSIDESKTPFPRHNDPVDAEMLRERLKATLERANAMSAGLFDYQSGQHFPEESSSTSLGLTKDTFSMKRKKFYAAEYAIAKQRHTNDSIHPVGSSVPNEIE